jgi:peroxiredoxin
MLGYSLMRVFLIAALCAVSLAPGEQAVRRAPGFSLPDATRRLYDLQDYRGKVVLIDIMKTDCPHCQVFSRILEQAKATYGERVAVLSVVHPPDTATTVARYVAENKVTVPVLFDCGQMAFSYIRTQSLQVPHLFIVDREGIIRGDFRYALDTREIFEGKGLFREIDRVLAASPPKR